MQDQPAEQHPRWNEVYRKKGTEIGIDRGDFIVAVDEEKAYALAPAVYYVWNMCDGETTVGKIVESLAEAIQEEVDIATLYNAVTDIIDKLVEVNLLEKVS
ncbi:PqqD family protein [Ignisphaera sp. 4213-co]|uniref:PqqD family protein n=1 Tax=Ignisphaera cupida TaxID=3050454 RepID=A0ABD4Z5A5_9CREN|nr:PqqD family protein [Ignisphaera sp. 4213-co]MDK6028340.1 PqqD family protein [Ignisphaera sp. 4213-co]